MTPRWPLLTLALGLSSLCLARAASAQTTGAELSEAPESRFPWQLGDRASVTGQWFWLQGKAMPGIELGVGQGLFEVDLELSFISLTERARDFDGSLLGNHIGAFLMLTPLRERYYDLSVGLGGDFYLLWAIHTGAREAALAPRAELRVWPLAHLALTFSARSYLVHGDGLALGTARDGRSGPPILLGTGITWGFH